MYVNHFFFQYLRLVVCFRVNIIPYYSNETLSYFDDSLFVHKVFHAHIVCINMYICLINIAQND